MSGLHRTLVALNLVGLSVLTLAGSAHAKSADLLDKQLEPQSESEAVSTSPNTLTSKGFETAESLLLQAEGRSPEQSLVAVAPTASLTEVSELNDLTATASLPERQLEVAPALESSQATPPSTFDPPLTAATTDAGLLAQATDDDGVFDEQNEPFEDNDGVFEDDGGVIEDDDGLFENEDEPFEEDPALDEEAQTDPLDPDTSEFSPGRTTRSGPSYIGVGGNIGLGDGDTALGEGSFAVFSKVGVTSNISLRPAVYFSDDPTILIPVTIDFIPLVTDATEQVSGELGVRVSPFVGAGAAISVGDDSAVDFLATGGVDIGITERFTGVVSVSASLFDNPAVGLLLGIGYNF